MNNLRVLLNLTLLCLASALVGAGLMYFKNTANVKILLKKHRSEIRTLKAEHYRQLSEMEAYVNSLSSRVNHLSLDNRRLSAVGYKLSQQLEENANEEEKGLQAKIAELKNLQSELSNLDQHLIHRYETYISQQKAFSQLSLECNNGLSKDKKCAKYEDESQAINTMASQIKFLNTKRDVLLSQIARAESF